MKTTRSAPVVALSLSLAISWLAGTSAAAAAASEAVWHERTEAAFAAARESGKLVLVDLYADWCTWCKVMDKEVFATPEFQRFASDYVLLRVDVEDGAEGTAIQRRYGAESLPALLLLDAQRALVGRIDGFLPTARLIGKVRMELAKYEAEVKTYQAALAGSNVQQWERAAAEWHRRGDGRRAVPLFEKLVAAPSADATRTAWHRFLLADSHRLAGDLAAAATAMAEAAAAAASLSSPQLTERIDWLGFAIARDARDCAKAQGALARLESGYPKSPLVSEARRDWTALKTVSRCS